MAACGNDAYRTGAGANLPDCRAYELVSPADKRGHDIVVDTGRSQVAQRESVGSPAAAMFSSLGGFAGPRGSGVAFDYVAERTLAPGTQGWSTHGINPFQSSLPFLGVLNTQAPLYLGEADADLSRMLFRSNLAIGAPATNVEGIDNLYLRNDLRDSGAGAYQLLTDAFAPVTPLPIQQTQIRALPNVAAVSDDLSRVVFESVFPLTPDAPPSTSSVKVYKAVDGVVQLVSILPSAEGGGPAPRAIAGKSAGSATGFFGWTPHVLSRDGSRAFFTVIPSDAVFGRSDVAGALYMRDDHGTADTSDDTTTRLDAPEGASRLTAPSLYWDAAADGSRVFFTTIAALTDDAPVGGDTKLYVYDASRPDTDPDNLTYISRDNESSDPLSEVYGTLGVSQDGRVAYFAQMGQIVAGEDALNGDHGVYAWQEGVGVRYVGALPNFRDVRDDIADFNHGPVDSPYQVGARVSEDGRYLLFSARVAPRPGGPDHGTCDAIFGGCPNLYLYDSAAGGEPVCVSCVPGVTSPTPVKFSDRFGAGGSSIAATHLNSPLTADGSRLYFSTSAALVRTDRNGRQDVYEYRVADRSLSLITSGSAPSDSYFLEVTPDGNDVYFLTRERLSPWDVDDSRDLYDARVGGGVPGPPENASACADDGCQGPLANPPGSADAGSSLLVSPPDTGRERPQAVGRIRVLSRALRRGKLVIRFQAPAAGRVVVSGAAVENARRRVAGAGRHRVAVDLRPPIRRALDRGQRVEIQLRVRFVPNDGRPSARRLSLTVKAR